MNVKVACVLSLPRLGWNDAWGCISEAMVLRGIPVYPYFGAFWGHCMQWAFEDMIKLGYDWVVTVDYDSVFTRAQFETMLETMADRPEIDALASLQPFRAKDAALMSGGQPETFTDPFPVNTAHFGLTILRVEKIASLKKPWFCCRSGEDGGWNGAKGQIDEDQWFWMRWKAAGHSLFVTPAVRIGHLEVMVRYFDEKLAAGHMPVSDWQRAQNQADAKQDAEHEHQPV